MKRRLGHIDLDTGEVFQEGTLAYFARKRQNGFKEGWVAMAIPAFGILKMFTRAHDLRVMMALLERIDFDNKISICQADIAKALEMDPSHVSHAIKRLVEAGVILKGPKKGSNCDYKLGPDFGWMGSAANHKLALEKHREEGLKKALGQSKSREAK
jgi:DNA-binding transcriptional ArsR family regulator